MDIFVYSDESGVFDKANNKYYVYGGLIFLGKESKDNHARKYIKAEKCVSSKYSTGMELKAAKITNKDKSNLFRSLNQCIKFCIIIDQSRVLNSIFANKKSKQRYLDYAYKIGLKHALKCMAHDGLVALSDIDNIRVFVDEHTTATNGLYELRESLLEEFKYGTHNFNYSTYFPPIIPSLNDVSVNFCNSETVTLIRSADIVANRIYYNVMNGKTLSNIQNLYITHLP